jgi:predicted  nucleic acid-binding Zn-ribbon protein
MALTRVRKITESKPFYAVAGAGDYAVEKLREVPEQLRKLQARRGELRGTAKDLPAKARETVAKDLPEKAREYADTTAAKFNKFYDDLAVRGRKAVSKVSREAAHEFEEVSESAKPAIAPEEKEAPARKPAPRAKATPKA